MEEMMVMTGLEEAFGACDVTSEKMRRAMEDWFRLYYEKSAREDYDPCLQLPYVIVRKLTRAVFGEYTAQTKGAFTNGVLQGLDLCRETAVEQALIGGESYLKPVTDGKQWRFRVLDRRQVLIFGRDLSGEITDMGTVEKSRFGGKFYTLLERRTLDKGTLVLRNRLFRSGSPGAVGKEVPLHAHPVYAGLPARFVFPVQMDSVGIWRMKNPAVNCIDGSLEGVSVYAPTVGLIRALGRNEAELSGEFSRGKSRIVVSADMLRNGKLSDSVFVGLDEAPQEVGITIFAPQLREGSYLARKQAYLKDVENIIGLKRGLLSQVEAVERTATEITSSEGEYALTIMDFQRMWQQAVHGCVQLCRLLGKVYGMDTDHEAVQCCWGNGVLYDTAKDI